MARRGDARSLLSKRVIKMVRVRPQLRYSGGPFRAVRFFELNTTTAEVEHVGTLTLRDGHLLPEPSDSVEMQSILDTPMYLYKMEAEAPGESDRDLLDPKTQPEAFRRPAPPYITAPTSGPSQLRTETSMAAAHERDNQEG